MSLDHNLEAVSIWDRGNITERGFAVIKSGSFGGWVGSNRYQAMETTTEGIFELRNGDVLAAATESVRSWRKT